MLLVITFGLWMYPHVKLLHLIKYFTVSWTNLHPPLGVVMGHGPNTFFTIQLNPTTF
jgi:hypothetical protein